MTKKAAKPEPATPGLPFAFPDRKFAEMVTWPIEFCLRLQADALRAGGVAMNEWLERRQDGVEAAFAACERLAACHDYTQAASVQHDWVDGALRRFGSDLQAATGHWLVLSRQAASLAESATPTRRAAWSVRKDEAVDAASDDRVPDTKTTAEAVWERR